MEVLLNKQQPDALGILYLTISCLDTPQHHMKTSGFIVKRRTNGYSLSAQKLSSGSHWYLGWSYIDCVIIHLPVVLDQKLEASSQHTFKITQGLLLIYLLSFSPSSSFTPCSFSRCASASSNRRISWIRSASSSSCRDFSSIA